METSNSPQVFISYAWQGDSEEFANQLEEAFQKRQIKIIRDKTDLGYRGLIKEFMERIGQGKCILVVISDKYLKSENCMFELVEIAKHGDFYDRIFPIVLKDAKIYKDEDRIDYLHYWDQKIKNLEDKLKSGSILDVTSIYKTLQQYADIKRNIDQLTDILKNINALTPELHRQSDFEQIIQAVETRLEKDKSNTEKIPGGKKVFKGRMQLMSRLNGIPSPQLEMIIFELEPPRGIIPASHAPQGDRVSALLNWANGEGGCGLERVEEVLNEVLNP
ncbi:toll/interleukin-1 receptor domain-containing protein [Gloeothece verrucosa]|uniref:TIR protein n=1 Tax=Gloeothece verrucosa (strain PCC 7822) TaxID=497965 RepID=E0UHN5_GLOV7|nr:toll/interleukin-1 receptor domain-containing protein [Gloeothece verrucosa]ADN13292.1 TIR protein [Gloeothece verrucosa PCC 7822]